MTPRSFYESNPVPVWREYTLDTGDEEIAGFNLDRFILAIWFSGFGITFIPTADYTVSVELLDECTDNPLILTQNRHGSLVNLAWRVAGGANGDTIIVYEGLIQPANAIAQDLQQWTNRQSGSPIPTITRPCQRANNGTN